MMSDLKWQDDPPNEPGYYWYANPRRAKTMIKAFEHDGKLWYETFDDVYVNSDAYDGEWAGPIPEPKDTDD